MQCENTLDKVEVMKKIKTIDELFRLKTFDERFKYLEIGGRIGIESFGYDRYLNQQLYKSPMWRKVRDQIILRDDGNDLGVEGYPIKGQIMIHHINPISVDDVLDGNPDIFNPDYLICCSLKTHNAIHYGNEEYLSSLKYIERRPNDTIPWR